MVFFEKLQKTGAFVGNTVINKDMRKQGQAYKDAERNYRQQIGSILQDSNSNPSSDSFAIGGKTVDEWESEWKSIGVLRELNLTHYNKYVGVYREWLNEKIIYIGKAIEWSNGGFKEMLSEYAGDGDNSRNHKSEQRSHEYSNQLHIDIIITGSHEENAKVATQLEARLIAKYHPEWNVKINI